MKRCCSVIQRMAGLSTGSSFVAGNGRQSETEVNCLMTSPTQLSLRLLRQNRYVADVAERWLPQIGRRRDVFHCADILACRRGESGALLVQCTTRPNVAARLAKSKQQPELRIWLAAGNRFEVWGWFRIAGRWRVNRVAVVGDDLANVAIEIRRRRGRRPVQAGLFD